MVAIDRIPDDLNLFSPTGYKFTLRRAPNLVFFVQSARIPTVSLPPVNVPTPFVNMRFPGDHIEYEEFSIEFKLDENLAGYIELYNWIKGLGFPNDYSQYKELSDKDKSLFRDEGVLTDLSLTLLTNVKNPNIIVTFSDAHPTSLSGFEVDSASEDIVHPTITATFAYDFFTIDTIQ